MCDLCHSRLPDLGPTICVCVYVCVCVCIYIYMCVCVSVRARASFMLISHMLTFLGDGPNTVSESTVSDTELSEFFGPQRVPGGELSEFLSA